MLIAIKNKVTGMVGKAQYPLFLYGNETEILVRDHSGNPELMSMNHLEILLDGIWQSLPEALANGDATIWEER